jgi:hypothetical protein
MFIALLALCVSILAIGMADKKERYLKLKVGSWMTKQFLGFYIENTDQIPLENIFISLRCQSSFINRDQEKSTKLNWKYHKYGETTIVLIDTIKYLSTEDGNNFIKVEFPVHKDNWTDSRLVFLSITAKDRGTTTYRLDKDSRDLLINEYTKSSKRLPLKRL